MELNLARKNVLIIGGSKGIGLEIAKRFIEENANVSIVGRSIEHLNEAKMQLKNVTTYQSDITNNYEREGLIEKYILDHDHIDILINNAGGSNGSSILETPMENFYEAFELNYFSSVHLSKLVLKHMKKQGSGNIINISSIYGRESGGKATYNNAKAALISFTKALAHEVIKYGVRVNSIAPGSVYHESGVWGRLTREDPYKIEEFVKKDIPAGRFGKPEEIADVVVYLSSEKASWIIGATINVDGGQSKMNF